MSNILKYQKNNLTKAFVEVHHSHNSVFTECNWTQTHNHLVRKRTLNHLAKLANLVFNYELSGCGFESSCSHLNFRFRTCFLDIQAIIECGFPLKRVRDMIRTYSHSVFNSQTHRGQRSMPILNNIFRMQKDETKYIMNLKME